MNEPQDLYEEIEELYQEFVEEDEYSPLQAVYAMIESFALFITKSKPNKIAFYENLIRFIEEKELNKEACASIYASYEHAKQKEN